MATVILTQKYRCDNDCLQSGCPEHEAKLTFKSVSDMYLFEDGAGHNFVFDSAQLEVFIGLLKQLNDTRLDCVKV